MLRIPKPAQAQATDEQPASTRTASHLGSTDTSARGVHVSPRMTAQRQRVQSWSGPRAAVVQRVHIVPYKGDDRGYSSKATFDKMKNVGHARGSGQAQEPESQPSSSSKMEAEEKMPGKGLATSSSGPHPLKPSGVLSKPEVQEWENVREKRLAQPQQNQGPWSQGRNVQSYAVIVGFDGDDDEPKVLLARKSVINRYTTNDGQRQEQNVEMRAPGQLGLPGGQSRALNGYELKAQPQAKEEPGIAPLAIESGADEALAETGINVRSEAFDTLGYTYARDEKGKAISGERTHAFFVYKGQISELAQRANEVLASLGTADNEVSQMVVAPLSSAVQMMEQTKLAAENQARQVRPKYRSRFIGDGVDWHTQPLEALQGFKHNGEEPAKLQEFPDAVKWIGESDETPLPDMLMPAEPKEVATTSTSLKEELDDDQLSPVEPEPDAQAMDAQVRRDPLEPQALVEAEREGHGKAYEKKPAKVSERTPGEGITGGQIVLAMAILIAIFALIAQMRGTFG